jgi:hypothetical protein
MELTMARDFKRGEPVVYYGNGRATPCFFGGKNGGYRVLSSTPDLESGWLVPLSSVLSEVFPAPNEHGVYAQDLATRIEYRGSATFHVAVDYLQIGPERWIAASEFRIGTRYRSTPLTAARVFLTLEEAQKAVVVPLLLDLGRLAAGADNNVAPDARVGAAHKATRRHGQMAVYTILSALPSPVQSDIIMLLMGET